MTQTIENIKLSSEKYRDLEEIAQYKGLDPSTVIENWISENIVQHRLDMLQGEYGDLIQKDLNHTMTATEKERLEYVIKEINTLQMQTPAYKYWERSVETMDRQFAELERRINALPDRETAS